jgi:hypothetical protein
MASATTQPANIFMAQSSWAATLGSSLAKSCDRHHKAVVCEPAEAVHSAMTATTAESPRPILVGVGKASSQHAYFLAALRDSDEVARAFRDDVARYSDMMSPGIPT